MRSRVLLSIVATVSLCAQSKTPVAHQNPVPVLQKPENSLRTQTNEVIVPVTVTTDKGKFEIDLEQQDFSNTD